MVFRERERERERERGGGGVCITQRCLPTPSLQVLPVSISVVHMVGEHEEVVAASEANREPDHFISVKFADGFGRDVEIL